MTPGEPDSPNMDDVVDADAARGPHLPDRWPALIFILLAVATAWTSYLEVGTSAWAPDAVASFVLGLVPPVCSVLLPGALLLRHPDATHRARTLLFGTLMFAAVPLFRTIEGSLQGAFNDLTPPTDDLGLAPLSIIYNEFQSLLVIFGVLYVALGLSWARRWAYARGARAASLIILFVAGATAAATIYRYSQVDLSGTEMTPALAMWIGSSIILAILSILAWAYLALTVTRCAMSGEEPAAGWFVAAIGTCLIVATFAIGAWSSVVQTTNESVQTVIFWLSTIMYSLGFLGLLGGFALGMPSLEPGDWDDEDEPDTKEVEGADDSDDEDDEDDEDEDDDAEEPAA